MIESSGNDRIEELADMLEVIKALAKLENKTLDDVIEVQNQKVKKRGAFDKKIFLEEVIWYCKKIIKIYKSIDKIKKVGIMLVSERI